MKQLSIDIIPAQPGFRAIYDSDEEVFLGGPVIAWRVESFPKRGDEVISVCIPLLSDGEAGDNCIGVQNPDMSVTVFNDSEYNSSTDSLAELQETRYPKK